MNKYAAVTAKACARCDRDYYGSYSDHRLSNEHARGIEANRPHPFNRVAIGKWCRVCGDSESIDLHHTAPA